MLWRCLPCQSASFRLCSRVQGNARRMQAGEHAYDPDSSDDSSAKRNSHAEAAAGVGEVRMGQPAPLSCTRGRLVCVWPCKTGPLTPVRQICRWVGGISLGRLLFAHLVPMCVSRVRGVGCRVAPCPKEPMPAPAAIQCCNITWGSMWSGTSVTSQQWRAWAMRAANWCLHCAPYPPLSY